MDTVNTWYNLGEFNSTLYALRTYAFNSRTVHQRSYYTALDSAAEGDRVCVNWPILGVIVCNTVAGYKPA